MDCKKTALKKQVLLLIFCWIMFVCFCFAAAQSAVTSVVNELQTGVIDISLEEYMLDETGKEIAWEDNRNIMPGDSISKIPKITNKAMDCWVRAKVKVSSKIKKIDSLSLEQIEGISDDWIKIGEYFYYKKIVQTKETVTLFQSIKIPAQWLKEHEENEIKIVIQVDAIQAKHFTPNFSKDTPWGGLIIEKCIHEDGYDLNEFRRETESSLTVEYEGNAKKLIAEPDDFFAQFGTLMPGDEQKDTVKIKNKGKNPVNIFFKTEGIEEAEFLEKTELTIQTRASDLETERLVYKGNLRSKEIENYLLLGCYESGYEGEFIFTLKLPEELSNIYSLEKRKVKWYFMAEEIDVPTISTTSTEEKVTTTTSVSTITSSSKRTTSSYNLSTSNSTNSNNFNPYKNQGEDGNISQKTYPKTGDATRTEFFFICAILSFIGIFIITKNLKKAGKE